MPLAADSIKSQLKKLAKEFALKYKGEWFVYAWVSKRENVLLEYIMGCPDPVYSKYGLTEKQRAKNISKFLASAEFRKCLKRYGGQVVYKKEWNKRRFGDNSKLLKLYNKFKKKDAIALLTMTNKKKEKGYLMKYILRHEWIHILLKKNNIYFQKKGRKYWPYDEGLNEYMASFLDNDLANLEKHMKNEKYPMEKKYWEYAIKFRDLLKNKKGSLERKNFLSYLSRL